MYQFLVRHVTEATLRNDPKSAGKVTAIIKRHFRPGTELYKEWRLFNAVIKTQGLSTASAHAVLRETRSAASKVDVGALDVEKLQLMDVVNRELGQQVFEHVIPTYRMYATVQTLFNDWRASAPDVVRIVDYEGKLLEHLTAKVEAARQADTSLADDALIVRLMTEKFNRKYGGRLLPRQAEILGRFTTDGSTSALVDILETVRNDAVATLRGYAQTCNDSHMVEKTNAAALVVESLDITSDVDAAVTQCMKLCELIEELRA